MDKAIVSKILEALKDQETGNLISAPFSCNPIAFSEHNFSLISPKPVEITYIDGGNMEIIGSPHFSLQYLRVASINLPSKKKIIKQGFILVKLEKREGKTMISAKSFGLPFSFPDIQADILNEPTPQIAVGVYRRLAELQIATESRGIICLDGGLNYRLKQEKELINKLKEKENICALSKTSRWSTNTGMPLLTAIGKIAPKGSWLYSPLFSEADYPANPSIVKLHRSSKYLFKLEVLKGNPKLLASYLAAHSNDPVFLGYPFGLIKADSLARVSEKEKKYFLTRFLSLIKNDQERILKFQRCIDSHDILDSIS